MTPNERFEALASLYYARYGDLAPGKDSAVPRSISQAENHLRYEDWIRHGTALNDVTAALVQSQEIREDMETLLQAAGDLLDVTDEPHQTWRERFLSAIENLYSKDTVK